MKDYEPPGSLLCYWSDLKKHPKCPHGPALLFGRENNEIVNKFYACSACRDRKLCSFYLEHEKEPTKYQKKVWEEEKKKNLPSYNHQRLYIEFNQLLAGNNVKRAYCHTCARLFSILDKHKHNEHKIVENLSDHQMSNPSEFLKPLENSKKEAQYLFSKKSVTDIINFLIDLKAESVLCIGAPRIHEYITQNLENKMSSLLLDFDGRFHNFFGPLNYCWYNLFNHHFFQEDSEEVFKQFLTQNKGKNMYLICDPPFGGRVEPISQTMKTISDLHRKLNKISDKENQLKIFFIFPYYMESVIREKSNPPNINGGLKDLKMTDYKVEYDNHPLFVSKVNNQQQGSQVRIFTNVPLNLIKLPESDGYKYCKRCDKWVAAENKHCKICHSCTSKDGRRYRHCKICERCVKPSWQHCKKCNRCTLPNHKCGQKPKVGSCYKCNEKGHTEKECAAIQLEKSKAVTKKRKKHIENSDISIKKQKLELSNNRVTNMKNKNSVNKKSKKVNISKKDRKDNVESFFSVEQIKKKKPNDLKKDLKETTKNIKANNSVNSNEQFSVEKSKKLNKLHKVTPIENFDDVKENNIKRRKVKKKTVKIS